MCLIIDTCCLVTVFDKNNKRHSDFSPVLDWIYKHNGKMIYGGTKYNSELRKVVKVLGIIAELERGNKIAKMDGAAVDHVARSLKARIRCAAFNDEHIAALVIVSRCRVVCTDDTAAIPYLKRADIYADYDAKPPKIYRRKKDHAGLCGNNNIVTACR